MSPRLPGSTSRPDPITPKVSFWTLLFALGGALITAAIDIGWQLPEGNNLMDWVRAILILIFAAGGVRVGAGKAKQHTTPLSDPRDEHGRKLVPAGTPDPVAPQDPGAGESGGFFDQDQPRPEDWPGRRYDPGPPVL